MRPKTISLILALIGSASFAAVPDEKPQLIPPPYKTESHWESFPLNPPVPASTTNAADLYKRLDFDINYHAPTFKTPEQPRFQGYITVRPNFNGSLIPKPPPATQSQIQTWKSFNFNGYPVFIRPAILNQTPTLIKDSTTGQTFYSQDPVSILRTKGTTQNLIDDRPKQK
jgi:hypothetical protein